MQGNRQNDSLQADIGKVLRPRARALGAPQALSSYTLRDVPEASQGDVQRLESVATEGRCLSLFHTYVQVRRCLRHDGDNEVGPTPVPILFEAVTPEAAQELQTDQHQSHGRKP